MRRFVLLQLSAEGGPQQGLSSFWKTVCGDDRDVWEVFQCYRAVTPSLQQLQGAAGVLLVGSRSVALDLPRPCAEDVIRLIREAVSDERVMILATGGAASLISLAVCGADSTSSPPEPAENRQFHDVYTAPELAEWPWAVQLSKAMSNMEESFRFLLSNPSVKIPDEFKPLIVASTNNDSNQDSLVPAAWCMAPNVLVLNVEPAPFNDNHWPTHNNDATHNTKMERLPVEALACMARVFLRGKGIAPSTIPSPSSMLPACESSRLREGNQLASTTRPDFGRRAIAMEEKSDSLMDLLRKALSVEAKRQTVELDMAKDIQNTTCDQYNYVDTQLKGMLAFLNGLKEKKQMLEPATRQVEQIEEKVNRLETLVKRLETAAEELETMCCKSATPPVQSS